MDVTLPNGTVIQGVPEDATKEQIMQKAISSGLATAEDFKAQEMPEGGVMSAILEPAKAIGASLGGQVLAGGAGLVELAKGQGLEAATEAVEGVQERTAEIAAPKTQAGQKSLQTISDLVEAGIDIAQIPLSGLGGLVELISGQGIDQAAATVRSIQDKGVGATAGDRVLQETNSPLMATTAYLSPEIVGSLVPVSRMVKNRSNFQTQMGKKLTDAEANPQLATTISDVSTQVKSGQMVDDVSAQIDTLADSATPRIAEQLRQVSDDARLGVDSSTLSKQLDKISQDASRGASDSSLVKYIKDGSGKAKADPLAGEAIKQGFDDAVIASVKAATPNDRLKMNQMIDILERGKKDARYAVNNRPSDVAGASLLERVNHIKTVNQTAGRQLDDVAKSLRGQVVDFDAPVQNFIARLDDMGVKLGDDLKPRFQGSDIEGVKPAENAINMIVNRMSTGGAPDAYDLHRLKKYIDEQVTYGKQGEGLAGKTERVLKQLRSELDDALDSQFPEYNRVNTEYSDTVRALDSLQDAAGKKLDLFGENADKAVGTVLRRLMSNTQGRVNLMDSIDEVEDIARRYGGKFDDDIGVQILFADELDSVFGPVARTAFQRSVGEGVKYGVEAVTGQKSGIGMLAEAAGKLADRARGINEDNALKAIRDLMQRQ